MESTAIGTDDVATRFGVVFPAGVQAVCVFEEMKRISKWTTIRLLGDQLRIINAYLTPFHFSAEPSLVMLSLPVFVVQMPS